MAPSSTSATATGTASCHNNNNDSNEEPQANPTNRRSSSSSSSSSSSTVNKNEARESRFTFRRRAEDLLRRDLKEQALQKCNVPLGEFAECAQATGLLVVFQCQGKLKLLNQCLAIHNGPEAWEKYKEQHKELLEKRARGQMS